MRSLSEKRQGESDITTIQMRERGRGDTFSRLVWGTDNILSVVRGYCFADTAAVVVVVTAQMNSTLDRKLMVNELCFCGHRRAFADKCVISNPTNTTNHIA